MTTFALVHGAWSGAWIGDALIAELSVRGARGVAVELPCTDPDAGLERYAETVVEALADAGDDVVLVGHSLGGLTIPLVPARRPIARLVYLCALLPRIGDSVADQFADDPPLRPGATSGAERLPDGGSAWRDLEAARRAFFAELPEEAGRAAAARLRPQARLPQAEPFPLPALPDTPATYVLARADTIVDPAWSRRAAPERLGVEPIELDGGHFPQLARPGALADVLFGVAS